MYNDFKFKKMKKLYIVSYSSQSDFRLEEQVLAHFQKEIPRGNNNLVLYMSETSMFKKFQSYEELQNFARVLAHGRAVVLPIGNNISYHDLQAHYYLPFWNYLSQIAKESYSSVWIVIPKIISNEIYNGSFDPVNPTRYIALLEKLQYVNSVCFCSPQLEFDFKQTKKKEKVIVPISTAMKKPFTKKRFNQFLKKAKQSKKAA